MSSLQTVQAQTPSLSTTHATAMIEQKGYSAVDVLYIVDGVAAKLQINAEEGTAYPVPSVASPNLTTVGYWAKRKGTTKSDFYQSVFMYDRSLGWFQSTIFDTNPEEELVGRRGVEIISEKQGKVEKDVMK